MLSWAIQKCGSTSNSVFQQDNCGPHRAKSIAAYLVANNVNVVKWPAQSSDLNPIENAWALLKRKVRERPTYAHNADHLFQILQEEWLAIPTEYFASLVRSIPSRVDIVKQNKGGATKY